MSETKSTEKQLEMELLREFAHEIRTPLNAMLGFSAMMKKGALPQPLSEDRIFDYADRINVSTRRLLQVCERVLDQAIQGQASVNKEDIDFHSFCPEIIRTFEVDAQERGITLNYAIAEDFPVLHTDPVVLYEIMSNLISNAIKFTPKGGVVTVKGERDYKNDGLILIVQDTGKGIPATILMSLMKGGAVTTSYAHSDRKGWGQGIKFVHDKVKLLGGTLEIENAMSGGTVACIRMPSTK
ncbi:HAMP domain-containing sensor histidine kinase [Magnetovibrio sp.]|uniref:sensor histidine kinase n=1 Tax=Magnetovibrio sp. TaxID=2024836 RepID=UPI002F94D6F8